MKRILLTGIGGDVAFNFARSLRQVKEEMYLVGTDCDKYNIHFGRQYCNKLYVIPETSKKDYITEINRISKKEEIDFVFPSPDPEVYEIAKNKNKLHAQTFLPSFEAIRIAQDKWMSYEKLKKHVPLPQTYLLKNEADLKEAFSHLKKPFWLRAAKGAGGKGSLLVDDLTFAKTWIKHWKGWGTFLASEYLPGKNFCWTGLFRDGKLVTSSIFERIRYFMQRISVSGITGNINVGRIVHRSDVNEIALKTVNAIDKNPKGVYSVDLREDEEGVPNITEINAGRFTMPHYFFTACGYNFSYFLVKLAYGENVPPLPKFNAVPKDFYIIRRTDTFPVVLGPKELDI